MKRKWMNISMAIGMAAMLGLSCRTLNSCESVKSSEPVAASSLRYCNADGTLWYDVSHDEQFVNVSILVQGKQGQLAMMHGGVRVYFSHGAKKDNSRYVQFPMRDGERRNEPRKDEAGVPMAMKPEEMHPPHDMQALWRDGEKGERIALNQKGQDVSVELLPADKNQMLVLKVRKSKLGNIGDKPVALGIELLEKPGFGKAKERPKMREGEEQDMDSPPRMGAGNSMGGGSMMGAQGGMSGMGRGGMKGGGHPPHDSHDDKEEDSGHVWVKILF